MKLDFRKMGLIKKVYWRIRLWHMDHRFSIWVPRYYILEPSYYYTHTEEEWENDTTGIFVHHTYDGKKSKPEYGINLSAKNIPCLERYKLEKMIDKFNE